MYKDITQQILEQLKSTEGHVTSMMLNNLITSNISEKMRLQGLWDRYNGEVEIKSRVFADANKVNNKLANNFRGLITNQLTSYVFGNPITYKISSEKYTLDDNDYLQRFLRKNNYEDMDYQTAEMMSVCGVAYRLLYIDIEGNERMMNINPWEVIYIKDQTLDEVQYAMIYYPVEIITGNAGSSNPITQTVTYVEWYDKDNVTFYIQSGADFILDSNIDINPMPHLFGGVPIIKFQNNNLEKGDWEAVETLIDAYDKTTSDMQNEIEEFRLSYLGFYGDIEPTPETMKLARQSGAFKFPVGTDAKFITKDINDTFLENHKKTLETNILKFSSVVDYTSESFSGGTVTGESRRWKLLAQENLGKMKEVKFSRALNDQFNLLTNFWKIKQIVINPEDIRYEFNRSLPTELGTSADIASKLNGIISQETLLSLMPFIDDPQEEIAKMKKEKEENANMINLDDITSSPVDNNKDVSNDTNQQ
jgi:SPP1 family phage portal protein